MDYQFSYYLHGSKNLQPILFLHGFMGNKDVFADTISLLSDKFYCLAVDLPGHGNTIIQGGIVLRTNYDECYQMEKTSLALVKLLDKLTIKKCFLVGYSMGGRLALYLALFFPERFPKVVLESSSPGLKTGEEREERGDSDRQLAKQLSNGNFSSFLSQWYQKPLFNSLRKHPQFQELKQRRLANNPLELAKSLLHMGTGSQPSLWHQLPNLSNLSNDLLLLVGERDNKFSWSESFERLLGALAR